MYYTTESLVIHTVISDLKTALAFVTKASGVRVYK